MIRKHVTRLLTLKGQKNCSMWQLDEQEGRAHQRCQGLHLLPDPTRSDESGWSSERGGTRIGIRRRCGRFFRSRPCSAQSVPGLSLHWSFVQSLSASSFIIHLHLQIHRWHQNALESWIEHTPAVLEGLGSIPSKGFFNLRSKMGSMEFTSSFVGRPIGWNLSQLICQIKCFPSKTVGKNTY